MIEDCRGVRQGREIAHTHPECQSHMRNDADKYEASSAQLDDEAGDDPDERNDRGDKPDDFPPALLPTRLPCSAVHPVVPRSRCLGTAAMVVAEITRKTGCVYGGGLFHKRSQD